MPELAGKIMHSLDGRLASYKIPQPADFAETLPRLATGKLVKGVLASRYRRSSAG